ncbi:MAG: relaxase/mobilization nuclease domain-containing protein [Proteobacteria bacterium]|nr:relaxase/mobilization nuclease domain-containing protein [Pseudomonadota bacterium]
MRIALTAEPPRQRPMPSGIASKRLRTAVSTHEATIAAILQPAQTAPREIITLVGTLGAGANPETDDELRRSGGGGGGAVKAEGIDRSLAVRPSTAKQAVAESTSRAAIAAGAQPVVIKVTSTVSSRASAAGLMTYLGTREVEKENGEKGKADIPIFDQDGVAIASREDRAAALQDWVSEFREPYALDAVATLSIKLTDAVSDEELHDSLNAAFGAKPFLYSRHPDGSVSVYAVTGLPAKKIAGALRAREKDEGPARTLDKAEADIAGRMSDAGVLAEVRIVGAAVSDKSGRYFLEKFLRTERHVITSAGEVVKRGPAVKDVADGIWRGWSADIRTVEPRNAFHVIFSARAGTDAEAMKRAVRDFLSEQVAGHRWITAHHPDTGHVHVHAMISARDDVGKALRLTKPELYAWRERFAAKAREQGIAMVATRRADVAATRPYSQAQAGAYERGLSDPRYLKSTAVNQRVERKRTGVADRATLSNGNLALAPNWQATAAALKQAGAKPSVVEAADRFAIAAAEAEKGTLLVPAASASNSALAGLKHLVETIHEQKEKTMALSLDAFDARVLRANKSMDGLERLVDGSAERQAVAEMRREITALFVAQRRDLEMQQIRSATDVAGGENRPSVARADGLRMRDQGAARTIDPAIAAQQHAIAAGRAARAQCEQAEAAKVARQERQQEIRRQAAQGRQNDKDRDGPAR